MYQRPLPTHWLNWRDTSKECAGDVPTLAAAEESRGETARLRLTEAFQQTLEAIAEEHPIILVVDDLHLCDEASLLCYTT